MTAGKLVRDLIPNIIREGGGEPVVRVLAGQELRDALLAKLAEESDELRAAADPTHQTEELADVLECVRGLAAQLGIAMASVEEVAASKRRERGGFDHGIWLAT